MNVLVKHPTLKITKITPTLGAEVTGIDLTKPVDEQTRQALVDALHDNIMLCFRDQKFTADQFEKAGALFGELILQDQPELYGLDGHPFIRKIDSRQKDHTGKLATYSPEWHTDHTHYVKPPKYTMLYPVSLPENGGGTSFCDTRVGYERLPADLKKKITPMRSINVLAGSAARNARSSSIQGMQLGSKLQAEQPLVCTHPDTGRKAIYFHPKKTENIIGMTPEDSQDLLAELMKQIVQPDNTYTHKWRQGDFVIWDNRSSLHKAGVDFDKSQHRLLYRMCVQGDKLN